MPALMKEKTDLIDYICKIEGARSFADLGGVWRIHAGYTFYALREWPIERAYLVDTGSTPRVMLKRMLYPRLKLIKSNFGDASVPRAIGPVDTIFLFDVLLHQVAPNWDDILRMYAKTTRSFIIYNQQYIGSKTVRLLDLGEEEYFRNVPHPREQEEYRLLFSRLDQMHPEHKRPYRDIHNIWQWGITDQDLVRVLREEGFEQVLYKNHGMWGNLKNFEGHAFVFVKRS